MLGALIIHGVQPGPTLMTQNPEIFWGVIASLYVGNIMLLVLNLPLVGIWFSSSGFHTGSLSHLFCCYVSLEPIRRT